jgi:hypothetical protein
MMLILCLGVVVMSDPGYPYKRLVVPPELHLVNGKLPAEVLAKLSCGGTGWFSMDHCGGFVFAMNTMFDDARKDGVTLKAVSEGYRSYARQEALFFDRYQDTPSSRKPEVIRYYQSKKYWLKVGKSPSATPGFSPHGFGLAQDLAVNDANVFYWLRSNAPKYGIFLQGPPAYLATGPNPEYEPWHWQLSDPANPTRLIKRRWRKFASAFK